MAQTDKIDLFKEHKADYTASAKTAAIIEPAAGTYLATDGAGAPESEQFQARIGAMYSVAYTVKMASKFAGQDYKVAPLEGVWWHAGDELDFSTVPREQWQWKLLIRTPPFITETELAAAREKLHATGKGLYGDEVVLETLDEGPCVQMLHVGPYAEEARTIEAMAAFAEGEGLSLHGRHHEIYLSDPRRTAPERLKTLLRHPVRRDA